MTSDSKDAKAPFSPSSFWFMTCSQYFPKLFKAQFNDKIDLLKETVENHKGYRPILIPSNNSQMLAHTNSQEEQGGILNWLENPKKKDRVENANKGQIDIGEVLGFKTGPNSERCIETQEVNYYPDETSYSVLFFRKFLVTEHKKEFPEVANQDAFQATRDSSIDDIINKLEDQVSNIQEERAGLWSNLLNKANNYLNILNEDDDQPKNKKSVDFDLRQATAEEDLYLDYIEYRRQYRISYAPYLVDPELSRTGGKSANMKQTTLKNEDQVCQVCNDGDYTDTNLIVYCSRCGICFHQNCYGITDIPEGNWVCELCK